MTPHTQAAFVTSFVDREGRQPTPQEVWDAAIRSYRDLAQPASVPEGRSQLTALAAAPTSTAVDAANLSGLMHDAAIRYSDGYAVDFDAEASDFLVGAVPQPASVPAEPDVGHSALAGMILTHLGYSTSPSLEPCADERRDRLAEKLAGWLSASPQAPQPAQAVPDADAERFRWLIDDRNRNENEDTPSICTSEDVHWGDKARALIDLHMNKD